MGDRGLQANQFSYDARSEQWKEADGRKDCEARHGDYSPPHRPESNSSHCGCHHQQVSVLNWRSVDTVAAPLCYRVRPLGQVLAVEIAFAVEVQSICSLSAIMTLKSFSSCLHSGPREDATRIGSAGVIRRQAVDISPLRRVNQAIYLLTTGARESAFRNIKTIAECLADELINAAKGSSNR